MNDVLESSEAAAVGAPVRLPPWRVDFERRVVCLLGLPFDVMDLQEAVRRIRADAFAGRRCFVSTPNLNFAILACRDAAFRGSVLRSDLSLVDGMPLVWMARLLGLPIRERVAGADLFEALQAHDGQPLTVFLFGGPPGVAALASERINRRGGGVRCVGFDAAGSGSIAEMSSNDTIERINRSGANFVVVALGAKKGQAWIEHNARRLTAPVLSHLGAVVNFAAGSVGRAPRWMRRSGLEWLWRIKEEPALWRRYGSDGLAALKLLFTHVLPDSIAASGARSAAAATAVVESRISAGSSTLHVCGDLRGETSVLRRALTQCAGVGEKLEIDVTGVTHVDNSSVGLLLLAQGWFEVHGGFTVVGWNEHLAKVVRRMLAGARFQ